MFQTQVNTQLLTPSLKLSCNTKQCVIVKSPVQRPILCCSINTNPNPGPATMDLCLLA
jgi:hypothetical protein